MVWRSGGSKAPPKKRLLPASKSHFVWAAEERPQSRTYFRERAVKWDSLGTSQAQIEAAAMEAAAIAAATAAAAPPANGAVKPSMLTPIPTRKMVRAPSHLVFRTKVVTRDNKPK
jgi:hypothetical protein